MQTSPRFLEPSFSFILLNFNLALIIGGWMLAVWGRTYMPFGQILGEEYLAWPPIITLILLGSVVVAHGIASLAIYLPLLGWYLAPKRQFRILVLAIILAALTILLLQQDVSQLQVVYFVSCSGLLGIMTIVLPGRLRQSAYAQINIADNLNELYHKRSLLFLWLRYRIEDRYAQTLLGIMWIILLPLSTSAVLAFAFDELLGAGKLPNGVSWINFLLSGIAVFTIFRDAILKSKGSILDAAGLISRVYFPREIIILLQVGEIVIDFIFVFISLLIINATQDIYPNWHYIFLPIPIIIVIVLSAGLSFILAWLGLVIRDLQQLLTVLIQLLSYVAVLYSPDRVSSDYRMLINMFPLTPIITAVRDIMLFNNTPDFVSLYYPFVLSIVLLYFGYIYFKVNEDRFMDFI